jgi:hypothetical protein
MARSAKARDQADHVVLEPSRDDLLREIRPTALAPGDDQLLGLGRWSSARGPGQRGSASLSTVIILANISSVGLLEASGDDGVEKQLECAHVDHAVVQIVAAILDVVVEGTRVYPFCVSPCRR